MGEKTFPATKLSRPKCTALNRRTMAVWLAAGTRMAVSNSRMVSTNIITQPAFSLAPAPHEDLGAVDQTERVDFGRLERVGCADFRPNRLAGFVRSANSWHGVRPLECPDDQLRKVFILEYRLDNLRERFRARTGI